MLGLVAVTGAPAAGKSTLAPQLADALGVRLVSKDLIKEAMVEAVGGGDESWSRILGHASIDAMLILAGGLETAVLEMYWRPETVARFKDLGRPIVEVFCSCPAPVLIARARQRQAERHEIHRRALSDEWAYRAWKPVFDGPVVEVDTRDVVDSAAVAGAVRQELPAFVSAAQLGGGEARGRGVIARLASLSN
ncbi:MAG: AAA family ATPase [Microlunatus sp.]|nr:AAA family ATPase [Microlunatus sp.]